MPQGQPGVPAHLQQPSPPSVQVGPPARFLPSPSAVPAAAAPPPPQHCLFGKHPHMANTGITQQPHEQQRPLGFQQMLPPYPSPAPNTFILYSLHFCPPLTSVCFGCGSSLKRSGMISDSPGDLVIVSNMLREWIHGGQVFKKQAKVYFHCSVACVRSKQPTFTPQLHCIVPDAINAELNPVHRHFVRECLGIYL